MRVGVVGAGQLGRMLHQAAIPLGVDLCFLAASGDDPAAQVGPNRRLGSAREAADLEALAAECDLITFEHELVDPAALEKLEAAGVILRPGAGPMAVVADKLAMRRTLAEAGIPLPPWRRVAAAGELVAAQQEWSAVMVKTPRGGYDGRGVFEAADSDRAAELESELLSRFGELLVEPRLPLDRELAVILARRPGGEHVIYDPVETIQVDGQCRQVNAPARLEAAVADQARELAASIADRLGVVGLLAVELFEVEGGLMVNELAVRPHNTGHHTIDAAVTSQFENHLRAILDLPLGDPALRDPAVMVNVVGSVTADDPAAHLAEAAALDPGARIHLYGKQSRPNRKLGHVTVCDHDPPRAARRAWRVAAALGGDVPDVFQEVQT